MKQSRALVRKLERSNRDNMTPPFSKNQRCGTPILHVIHGRGHRATFFKLTYSVITRRGVRPVFGEPHSLKFPMCESTQQGPGVTG